MNTFTIVTHFNNASATFEKKMLVINKTTTSKHYIDISHEEILRIRMKETVVRMNKQLLMRTK